MKKLFALTIILTLVLAGCEDNAEEEKTTLDIANMSSYNLHNVEYSSVDFFIIKSGSNISKEVSDGTKYVFFSLRTTTGKVRCRINNPFTCEKDKKNEMVILDNTIITNTDNGAIDSLHNICSALDISNVLINIGDTGPGGGTVFYAEGGQFKECSGELGTYNWEDAMATAKNYQGGGFTNWHLPDRGELDLMYRNLHQKILGEFLTGYYWTSAEYSDKSYAYSQDFSNGLQDYFRKTNAYRVRAAREFNL